jgi:hypothetical protein
VDGKRSTPDDESTPPSVVVAASSSQLRGWLYKKGAFKTSAWKRRWCVYEDGLFSYYKNKTDRLGWGFFEPFLLTYN